MVIDFSKLKPVDEMKGDDEEDTKLLRKMFYEACEYLQSFSWCKDISESYFGLGVGNVVAVFLFRIIPAVKKADEWLWVVIGDVPPAYLVTDDAPNPACALDAYIGEMEKWIKAVNTGRPVDKLIPVNVSATPTNAQLLQKRLDFIEHEILAYYPEDLQS